MKKPQAIGIDFGTTNTAAAALYEGGESRLLDLSPSLENENDRRLLKSLIYFPNRREAYFGQDAIDRYFDRDMEGRFLQSVKKLLPNSEFQGTSIHGQFMSVEDLIARFLTETRVRIEKQIGMPITDLPIVMGRPARYSTEPGNEGLAVVRFRKACELAGYPSNIRFVEEPVAAAYTYHATLEPGAPAERVLIVDLGGGTSDFTLLQLGGGSTPRVLGVNGVPVAGDTIDSSFMLARLARHFGSEVRYQRPFSSNVLTLPTSFTKLLPKWHHHAFLKEKSTWNFLKTLHNELVDQKDKPYLDNLITLIEDNLGYMLHQRVERVKVELSSADRTQFVFRSHPIGIDFEVTLADFENLIASVVETIRASAMETLRIAHVEPGEVDALYFTGGTSRVPAIRRAIQECFPKARVAEKDTFTSVATGLALSATSAIQA